MTSPDAAPDSGQCSTMPPDGGAPPSGDMAGTWASLERTYAIPHGFSERQIAWVTYLERHTLSNDGYAVEEEMCTLEIDGEQNLTFGRVLPAYPGSTGVQQRTATLVSDGAGGFSYHMPVHWAVRGISITPAENIPTEPWPPSTTDPRIGDWDGDGHPGMTMLLTGVLQGQAYSIERDWTELTGAQIQADRVEGLVSWNSEQLYLGSDPSFIADLHPTAVPDSDPNLHRFQLVRVPSGSDCAYVIAHRCDLFHAF